MRSAYAQVPASKLQDDDECPLHPFYSGHRFMEPDNAKDPPEIFLVVQDNKSGSKHPVLPPNMTNSPTPSKQAASPKLFEE
jgi:hypothetical protein